MSTVGTESQPRPHVVLGVGGGIAAYKACELLRLFTESGHDVTVVPTAAALRFVGESTWAALSGRPVETLEKDYAGRGYGDLKTDLADLVTDTLGPFRERALGYLDDPTALDDVLAAGADKARAVAARTLAAVYERVGFLPPRA